MPTHPHSPKPSDPAVHTVQITPTGFSPKKLDLKVGETVTWVNDTKGTANVTFDLVSQISEDVAPGKSFNHTVTAAGEHGYHSKVNPAHTGTLVVK